MELHQQLHIHHANRQQVETHKHEPFPTEHTWGVKKIKKKVTIYFSLSTSHMDHTTRYLKPICNCSRFCDERHILTITNQRPMFRMRSIPPSHNKTEVRQEDNPDTSKYIRQCPDILLKKPDEIHILVAKYINF